MNTSEMFEGENSSLRKTFESVTTQDTEKNLLDPTQPTHTGNLYGGKVIYKDIPDTECPHHQVMREGGDIALDRDGMCCHCGEEVLEKTGLVPQNKPDTEKCCEKCRTCEFGKYNPCYSKTCSCHTPDTEWEKEFEHLSVSNLLSEKDPTYGEENRRAKQQLKTFIAQLRSSRDIYWKKMLSGVCLTHGCFCQHSCKHPCTCTEAVDEAPKLTNKDNLK